MDLHRNSSRRRSGLASALLLAAVTACTAGSAGPPRVPSTGGGGGGGGGGGSGLFVTAYWAEWDVDLYPVNSINWSAITHGVIAFVHARWTTASPSPSLSPYQTLEMDQMGGVPGPQGMKAFADAAHAGGSKALFSVGGAGNGTYPGGGFAAAANATHRAQFIKDMLDACQAWGFDGVDLDWEDSINWTDFRNVIIDLRAAAGARGLSSFVITVPIGGVNTNFGASAGDPEFSTWVATHQYLDQLNPMSYTMTGVYPDWYSWHFNPLFGHATNYPVDVASTLSALSALGIPKAKLGVGLGFYGIGYGTGTSGQAITAPRQPNPNNWWPSSGIDGPWSHGDIMNSWYGKGGATYVWDDVAKAGYLTWTTAFSGGNGASLTMLSYEDERSIAEKGAWAKANGYGGAMIWTINDGVQYPRNRAPYNNPLLDAVKQAFR